MINKSSNKLAVLIYCKFYYSVLFHIIKDISKTTEGMIFPFIVN